MNIIVTGGSGRIGRYVVAELVRHKHHVTSVDVKPLDIQGSRFVRADITDFDQIRQVLEGQEAVVHMGAWAMETIRRGRIMFFKPAQIWGLSALFPHQVTMYTVLGSEGHPLSM